MTKLWVITFEHQEPMNIFSVGVDMDDETAEMLVLKELNTDNEDMTLQDFEVGRVFWEAVPSKVDGFDVRIEG